MSSRQQAEQGTRLTNAIVQMAELRIDFPGTWSVPSPRGTSPCRSLLLTPSTSVWSWTPALEVRTKSRRSPAGAMQRSFPGRLHRTEICHFHFTNTTAQCTSLHQHWHQCVTDQSSAVTNAADASVIKHHSFLHNATHASALHDPNRSTLHGNTNTLIAVSIYPATHSQSPLLLTQSTLSR